MTNGNNQYRANKGGKGGKNSPPGELLKTWAFDSVGPKKYAIQLKKARNGNPYLKFTEGTPQDDGSFRKFSITVWSEDFRAVFEQMDQVRNYLNENKIRTPKGHKYEPDKEKWKKSKGYKSRS